MPWNLQLMICVEAVVNNLMKQLIITLLGQLVKFQQFGWAKKRVVT